MSEIAELFLIDFIRNIIEIKAPKTSKQNNQIDTESIKDNSMQVSINKEEEKEKKITLPKFNVPQIKKIVQPIVRKPSIKPVQRPKINYSIQSNLSATEKLNVLIKDPYVNEIECNGADNPLMVKKSGMTQNTQINLTIEEIYEIVAEFSQRTRIPVISGRIKAALDNLIITAVLSETLGPRFIIQKKKPFQELI